MLPSEPDIWATWDREAIEYAVVGTVFDSDPTSTTAPATTITIPWTTTSTSAPGTTTSETSAPSNSALNTSGSSETPSGLSTSAKAGIGAGAGVGAIVVAAVAYLLWKTRKNGRAAEENKQSPPISHEQPPVDGAWQQSHYAPKEPQIPQELHGHQYQGYDVRAELPAHN